MPRDPARRALWRAQYGADPVRKAKKAEYDKEYRSKLHNYVRLRENQRTYVRNNPEKKVNNRNFANDAAWRLRVYKSAAEKRGYSWELSEMEAVVIFESSCTYCGLSPSTFQIMGIDRRDNSKGYTSENAVPCCKNCNTRKHTKTEEEFKKSK